MAHWKAKDICQKNNQLDLKLPKVQRDPVWKLPKRMLLNLKKMEEPFAYDLLKSQD